MAACGVSAVVMMRPNSVRMYVDVYRVVCGFALSHARRRPQRARAPRSTPWTPGTLCFPRTFWLPRRISSGCPCPLRRGAVPRPQCPYPSARGTPRHPAPPPSPCPCRPPLPPQAWRRGRCDRTRVVVQVRTGPGSLAALESTSLVLRCVVAYAPTRHAWSNCRAFPSAPSGFETVIGPYACLVPGQVPDDTGGIPVVQYVLQVSVVWPESHLDHRQTWTVNAASLEYDLHFRFACSLDHWALPRL
jgi:hypothetical protein